MITFNEYLKGVSNNSNPIIEEEQEFLEEAYSPEMKKVFTKAELANAGRAMGRSHNFNLQKTSFKEVDASVINKNAKTLDNRMVLVKTSMGAWLIKYHTGGEKPITVYNLTINTKERTSYYQWKDVMNTISRKDIASEAVRVFISTEEVYDRHDIEQGRAANKPMDIDDAPSLNSRLRAFKADKSKSFIVSKPEKSFKENGNLAKKKAEEHIRNEFKNATIDKMMHFDWSFFEELVKTAYEYNSCMEYMEHSANEALVEKAGQLFNRLIGYFGTKDFS